MRRLPAEFEQQRGVVIAWPFAGSDWTPFLQQVEPEFVAFAGAILERQTLVVLCRDEEICSRVHEWLGGHPLAAQHLILVPTAYDDTWVRDYGPLSVEVEGTSRLVDFGFDGWAGKYDCENDARVTRRLHAAGVFGQVALERQPVVLEGGSIDSDGQGTLLTTHGCLLDASRNPGLDQAAMEKVLADALGATPWRASVRRIPSPTWSARTRPMRSSSRWPGCVTSCAHCVATTARPTT